MEPTKKGGGIGWLGGLGIGLVTTAGIALAAPQITPAVPADDGPIIEMPDAPAEPVEQPRQASPKPAARESACHPSYSGCLKVNAGDYDCAGGSGNGPNYTGSVRVTGPDVFDLDRNNNGWGCE